MPHPRSLSLRLKVGITLGLVLTAIWTVVLLDLEAYQANELRIVEQTTIFQSQAFAENILTTIRRIDDTLLDLGDHWVDEPDNFAGKISSKQRQMSGLNFEVRVFDTKGRLLYPEPESARGHFSFDSSNYPDGFDGRDSQRLHISKPIRHADPSGAWSIQFARAAPPVHGAQRGHRHQHIAYRVYTVQ